LDMLEKGPIAVVSQREACAALIGLGKPESDVQGKSGPDLTAMLVSTYKQVLPGKENVASSLSDALQTWQRWRDKQVAHDEAVSIEHFPVATWTDSHALLDFGKRFVGMVGSVYLSTAYQAKVGDVDEYLLTTDAKMNGMAMRRLLRMAGLAPDLWCAE
jgi:hypothetical protein